MRRTDGVDLGVVAALCVLGALGFQPVYGGASFALPAFGGLAVGIVAVVVARMLRLPLLGAVAVAVAGYFLLGSALAMPAMATFGVLPNLETLRGLVRGAVFGWSDAVTLTAPLQAPAYIWVVAYVACWAAALIATAVVAYWPRHAERRSPLRCAVATAAPLALLMGTILLGTHRAFLPGVRGALFAAIALCWICWKPARDADATVTPSAAAARRRRSGIAIVVVGALLVGGGASLATHPTARFVVRDQIVPPFDPLDYPSPLAAFRKYVNDETSKTLFTVSGLEAGSHVRLATMDSWDGVVWNVSSGSGSTSGSGAFRLLGHDLKSPRLFTAGQRTTATFTIKDYTGVWLPSGSYPTELRLTGDDSARLSQNLRVNTDTGTVALTDGASSGLTYTEDVTALATPSEKQLAKIPYARIDSAPISDVPDVVSSMATQYAGGATSALQVMQNLQKSLIDAGYLSHGRPGDAVKSRAGEGADRVEDLFDQTPMVGDQEQYVTAFALMAHSLGYPVRVVLGAKVPKGSGAVDVTGGDVTAWDEVAFDGVGWVPFFPTPKKTDAPQEQTVKPKLIPQPQVRQPPRDHGTDDQLLTPVQTKDHQKKHHHTDPGFPIWAWVTGGSILALALIVLVPLGIVALLRRARRRRRRRGPGDRSAAGAWSELTSRLSELGLSRPGRATTRRELADHLATSAPAAGLSLPADALAPLARRVDHEVWAGGEPDQADTSAIWAEVDRLVRGARASLSWMRRRLTDYRYSRL